MQYAITNLSNVNKVLLERYKLKHFVWFLLPLNSLKPGDAFMGHWTLSPLVPVMAYRMLGTKPLPEPMVTYCQLDP